MDTLITEMQQLANSIKDDLTNLQSRITKQTSKWEFGCKKMNKIQELLNSSIFTLSTLENKINQTIKQRETDSPASLLYNSVIKKAPGKLLSFFNL